MKYGLVSRRASKKYNLSKNQDWSVNIGGRECRKVPWFLCIVNIPKKWNEKRVDIFGKCFQ